MKICHKCKLTKNVSSFFKNKRNKDGLQYLCKACQYAYTREVYYPKHRDRLIKKAVISHRGWRKANPDKWHKSTNKAYAAYYERHKIRIRARKLELRKEYVARNKDKVKAQQQQYREKIRQLQRHDAEQRLKSRVMVIV